MRRHLGATKEIRSKSSGETAGTANGSNLTLGAPWSRIGLPNSLHRETWVVLNYALGNDERSLPKASAARLTDMMGFYTCQRASCDLPLRQRTRHARPTRIRTLTAPWLMTISRLRRLRSPLSSRPPAKKRSNRRGSRASVVNSVRGGRPCIRWSRRACTGSGNGGSDLPRSSVSGGHEPKRSEHPAEGLREANLIMRDEDGYRLTAVGRSLSSHMVPLHKYAETWATTWNKSAR